MPALGDFTGRASTFGNHLTGVGQVPRGGDLIIRYPDGSVRNLTREAGFGTDGFQGANAIAVREPSVHWSGSKAVFSMLVGSPTEQTSQASFFWQLYEVSGLGQGQTVVITKLPNQPANYNNVSPLYGTDDRILFTSDRPRSGMAHLYPTLDEYESAPTVTGIWRLDPASGALNILNHSPSGAFSPTIDSYGRVVFTRWDHLQRDQQNDAGDKGAFNYTSEAADAVSAGTNAEVFPEPRDVGPDRGTVQTPYGPVLGHRYNVFSPWQMNQDGTEEETLNHVGRHELNFGYLQRTFVNDPSLNDLTDDRLHANRKQVNTDGGLFHLREDPTRPGTYLAIQSREFGSLSTNQIVQLTGAPTVNGDQMMVTDVTVPLDTSSAGGRYRNPLPLVSGALVATHTAATSATPSLMKDFRLRLLSRNTSSGLYEAGAQSTLLTPGIVKSVTWFNPDNFSDRPSFSGPLWEMEAVEVVARPRPVRAAPALETPEASVFAQQGINVAAFRQWMASRDLALIVTRNVTSRDDADIQQPFNLQVPGGVKTLSSTRPGPVYPVSHLQIFQADQIRAYSAGARGRRNIAQALHAPVPNPPNPGAPAGSVKIGSDGSTAAFVPARRALGWQTTDAGGVPIVRERVWVSFQPGEVRVCASCHGANDKDQAGRGTPQNEPEALRSLLAHWKTTAGAAAALRKGNAAGTR